MTDPTPDQVDALDEILLAVFTKGYNDAPGNPLLPHLLMGKELTVDKAKAKLLILLDEAYEKGVRDGKDL